MEKIDTNHARGDPLVEVVEKFSGSTLTKYGPHIEFDLRFGKVGPKKL